MALSNWWFTKKEIVALLVVDYVLKIPSYSNDIILSLPRKHKPYKSQ